MDGQEYLNQLSANVRPVKKSRAGKILSSKLFMVAGVGLILLVIIVVIGAIISGGKGNEKNLTYALKVHLANTAEIVKEYQPSVKSSDLRSSSASLYSILTNTDRDLTNYLTEKYNFKDKDISSKVTDEATLMKDELESDLFEAKIGGTLDRIFANKMTYEISLIQGEEAKLISNSRNDDLKELLTKSYNSLENLYENFNSFSETK